MFGSVDITEKLELFKKYLEAQMCFEILPNLSLKEGSPVYELGRIFDALVKRTAEDEPISSGLFLELLKLQALSELCHRRLSINSIFGGKYFDFSEDLKRCDIAAGFVEAVLQDHPHFYFKDLSITATDSILMVPPQCHIYRSLAIEDIQQSIHFWNSFFRKHIKAASCTKLIVDHLCEISDCKSLLQTEGW